ncbi:MAG: MarR family EPS-associated transcriptional regulator [Pseudomonadota bacterium]
MSNPALSKVTRVKSRLDPFIHALNNLTEQETCYRLLKLLSRNADLTQREMAVKMGFSLGKVNYCLAALAEKGLIKINRFKDSRNKLQYLYHLTPRGLEAKVGMTLSFLKRKMAEYGEIKQGRRSELQGGGLIRSSGGDKAGLLGLKKEDREKSDQRILGRGDFVSTTLQQSERILEKKYLPKRPIEELIEFVGGKLSLTPELICSGSRQKKIAEARALVAYLAVEETGHSAADVARYLGIGRASVLRSIRRAVNSE